MGTAGVKGFTMLPAVAAAPPQADAEKEQDLPSPLEAKQDAIEHGNRWCQWLLTQGFTRCRALHTQTHKSVAIHAMGRRIGRSV